MVATGTFPDLPVNVDRNAAQAAFLLMPAASLGASLAQRRDLYRLESPQVQFWQHAQNFPHFIVIRDGAALYFSKQATETLGKSDSHQLSGFRLSWALTAVSFVLLPRAASS